MQRLHVCDMFSTRMVDRHTWYDDRDEVLLSFCGSHWEAELAVLNGQVCNYLQLRHVSLGRCLHVKGGNCINVTFFASSFASALGNCTYGAVAAPL